MLEAPMSGEVICECEDGECPATRRLVLRQPVMADVPAITSHLSDYAVVSMLSRVPWPYDAEDAEDFVRDLAARSDNRIFAVTLRDTGELIGVVGLHGISEGRAELGYWLARKFWGLGYGTEAVQRMIDFGFGPMELSRIDVSCRVVNDASRHIIRKCGFFFVGPGMTNTVAAGRVASEHYMLDECSWRSIRMWGR
ncbi:GNAT family N-acetyltransferase [Fulvimarina endophytica]